MISEEDFAAAARDSDPSMAFVRLETRFREALKSNLERSDSIYSQNAAIREYMNHTIAAARFFNFDLLDFFKVPDPNDAAIDDTYQQFTAAVDLARIRAPLEYSVGLSNTDKDKLRFYVAQMKTIIDDAKLPEDKRDALMNILNKFLAEVDRNRAPWNIFADFVINLATIGGEAAKKLEPARKWINSIANLLGHNKEIENSQPRLPKPEQKKIEDNRPKTEPKLKPKQPNDMDDEIPF